MALKKLTLKTTHLHAGKRLDQVLADWLPEALSQPLSKAKVRKLIVAGAVYLNGKRVRIASKGLLANARVDAYVDLDKLEGDGKSKDLPFVMTAERILFEDEYLIIVNKPPGLPTQPTLDEARDNLFASLKRFLSERDKVAQTYLGLHHRLDRDTSGVVLFTKAKEANSGVGDLFSKHIAVKTYHALSIRQGSRLPPRTWTVKNYLGRAPGAGKKARFTAVRSGGDFAHTEFKLIEALNQAFWIQAQPRTGRTHQIRVHLAEGGMPILGDSNYGGPKEVLADGRRILIPRVMLHAVSLTFPHPIHKTEISVESPLPEDFSRCLQAFRLNGRSS